MSPLQEDGILVSADSGVDPRVVPGRLRRSWGSLARRSAPSHGATPPGASRGGRP